MRVLVVEDDSYIRQLTIQVLEDEGYAVMAARNGAEALEAVRSTAPELILLDLMMPVLDGVAFLEKCRQLPGCRDVPIVVMSAAGMRGRYARLDVEAWIDKPFDLDVLIGVVGQTLQRGPLRVTEDVRASESNGAEQRH